MDVLISSLRVCSSNFKYVGIPYLSTVNIDTKISKRKSLLISDRCIVLSLIVVALKVMHSINLRTRYNLLLDDDNLHSLPALRAGLSTLINQRLKVFNNLLWRGSLKKLPSSSFISFHGTTVEELLERFLLLEFNFPLITFKG